MRCVLLNQRRESHQRTSGTISTDPQGGISERQGEGQRLPIQRRAVTLLHRFGHHACGDFHGHTGRAWQRVIA
jgi:hypothetical protein